MVKRIHTLLLLYIMAVAMTWGADKAPCPLSFSDSAKTDVAIMVRNLSTGDVLAEVNPDLPLVPASITKALTTASVLSQLPPDMTFITRCFTDGIIADGELIGNLVIECSADPTIESPNFKSTAGFADSIAVNVSRLGVKSIKGDILFSYPPVTYDNVPTGWMDEDLMQGYGASHYPFNYAANRAKINLATATTIPPAPKMKIVRMDGRGVKRDRNSSTLFVGRNANGTSTIVNPDPLAYFDGVLAERLKDAGVELKRAKVPAGEYAQVVYTHKSPNYEDIMRSLMLRSDNLMAEGMLRTLAPTLSRNAACRRELSLWEARGLDTETIFVEDGSGLSRKNRLTARFMSDMLRWMINSEDADTYLSFFPKAGESGTMRGSFVDTPLAHRLATKTGSMRGVQCFAGYLLDDDGKPTHTVVVMANGFNNANRTGLKKALERYLIEILQLKNNN